MDNQQVPKADSKFQKIVRANHRKWKIRLLSKGGQKADAGGSPYKEKPDYKMGKSAPDILDEGEQLNEIIVKRGDKFCLVSKSKTKEGKRKSLGCYPSREGAKKREKQVQYFKHLKEEILKVLEEVLQEEKKKDDRCVRIAKRKYKAWPSAYASGAVVKCRQGKIWKSVKEEGQELEEDKKLKHKIKKGIASALATMTAVLPPPDAIKAAKGKKPSAIIKREKEELEEEWSDSEMKKRKTNCSNPKGFTMKQFCKNQRTRSKEGEKTNEGLEERKLGKPSSETNLGDWFKRKGAPGKKGGWVDCNTCRDGKCKPCGRQDGEKRSKYPRCRPTPSQCKGYKRRGDNLQKEEQE
jgi:hypothetical protein